MMKQKITRFACLFLAFLFLVSTATVAVSADTVSGVTDKSIGDYVDELNTISYAEYVAQHANYFDKPNPDFKEVAFNADQNWVFTTEGRRAITVKDEKGKEVKLGSGAWYMSITLNNDAWSLQVLEDYRDEEDEVQTRVWATYTSVDDAVAAGIAEKEEMVYVTDEYDGVKAIYTPSLGTVTWTLDLGSVGLNSAFLCGIELDVYSVVGKSAAAEREFYIDGNAPFSEARALTFSKIYSSFKPDGKSTLTYGVKVGKDQSLSALVSELEGAGLKCSASEDGSIVYVERPDVITSKINEMINKYGLRFFVVDANNSELRPTMVQTPEWTTYSFRDTEGFHADNFGFVLDPTDGKITFSLEGVNEAIAISAIRLVPYETTGSYADYLAYISNNVGITAGSDTVRLEAESMTHSSTNVVYPLEDRTSPMTSPADVTRTVLNTIGTEKWSTAGQWVEYKVSLNSSGMYDLFSRYKQSYLDGVFVSRSLRIFTEYGDDVEAYKAKYGNTAGYYNGLPFAEAAELRYDYGAEWQVTDMNAGRDDDGDGNHDSYQIYFEKDVVYTLRFEVTLGSMSTLVATLEDILDNLNADYLSILKLTGSTPDDYRDYKFSRLLPDTLMDMMKQAAQLRGVSKFLKETAEIASSYTGICDQLEQLLTKLAHDEDEIAKNLNNFKSYVGNLGTFLTDSKTQPLQLDYVSIQPMGSEPPKVDGNFFQKFAHEFKSFIQSFIRDYNSMGAMETSEDQESIEVWLAYGRDQSQVIRNLATNEFTPDTGIAVDLKLVAGSTLLPSILAGRGPDVYLGLADATVINYAIRGALTNIENKEGFDEFVDAYFTRAAMLQLEIADADGVVHTYGLPETQTFNMMFVRLDILADLEIEIPKTWEDIYVAQSKLQTNNMEIGVTTNYKMFLYQTNGDLYADDGMRINLDSVKGLAAFEKMCNMFTQYSFPYKYNAANCFRTGEMPIIIADCTGLYNQLKVFATELQGKWAFFPVPGTIQADGSINNTADSTIAAVVMISGIENEDAAWEYMKWYTGAECQSRYANEMVAIIGDSAKHPTANRDALKNMPWTISEYNEVSKQFENLAAIPNYPGSYYLDRHTSFAFLAAYNDDADPSTEILSYINTINNEITRKRQEFNLETLEIGQTLASKRMDQAMDAMEILVEEYGESKYKDAIEAAKYAMANEKIGQLYDTAKMFAAFLDYNYVEEIGAIDSSLSYVQQTAAKDAIIDKVKTYDFFVNVGKQTHEVKNGGFDIADLNETSLVYFIAECLRNASDALASY